MPALKSTKRETTRPRIARAKPSASHGPRCPHYPDCFGCPFIDVPYPEQLRRKEARLAAALAESPNLSNIEAERIIPSPQRLRYRARVKLVVDRDRNGIVAGLYRPGTHRVSDITSCPVHPRAVNEVVGYLKQKIARLRIEPYDQPHDLGQLRYLDIRYSLARQEVAVTLVTRRSHFPEGPTLARATMRRFRFVSGVVQNVNEDTGNVIWGKRFRTLAGRDSIVERNGFLQLRFPAGVFSQVNPRVARKLYAHVLKVACPRDDDVVLDVYCGVGPISLHLASCASLVWGVDENPLSIATAKQNARMNGFGNCRFFAGEATETLERAAEQLERVDTITVNPPRKGIQPSAMAGIVSLRPSRLIYVSCEPATLARDLAKLLKWGYRIDSVQPFDMFPQTEDLETVVSLTADAGRA